MKYMNIIEIQTHIAHLFYSIRLQFLAIVDFWPRRRGISGAARHTKFHGFSQNQPVFRFRHQKISIFHVYPLY